jgi:hypothetical protein
MTDFCRHLMNQPAPNTKSDLTGPEDSVATVGPSEPGATTDGQFTGGSSYASHARPEPSAEAAPVPAYWASVIMDPDVASAEHSARRLERPAGRALAHGDSANRIGRRACVQQAIVG